MFSVVIDDFIESFDALRRFADRATFADITSPVDGVVYPNICMELPDGVMDCLTKNVETIFGCPIKVNYAFMRLSPEGVHVPHPVHTDVSMGKYSLMLYLNRKEHCRGGTSILKHTESGMLRTPRTEEEFALWQRDMRNPEAWSFVDAVEMQPNRAFIFDADMFHRAEPEGGFGKGVFDGRLVLTMFFDPVTA